MGDLRASIKLHSFIVGCLDTSTAEIGLGVPPYGMLPRDYNYISFYSMLSALSENFSYRMLLWLDNAMFFFLSKTKNQKREQMNVTRWNGC